MKYRCWCPQAQESKEGEVVRADTAADAARKFVSWFDSYDWFARYDWDADDTMTIRVEPLDEGRAPLDFAITKRVATSYELKRL